MEDLLRVGVISSAHGIKGEVNVFPTTDEPEMFAHWKTLRLVEKKQSRLIHVRGAKYFKNMVILSLEEIADRNQAELLRQAELYITRDQATPCGENENFITDLIGLRVVDENKEEYVYSSELIYVNKVPTLFDCLNNAISAFYNKDVLIPTHKKHLTFIEICTMIGSKKYFDLYLNGTLYKRRLYLNDLNCVYSFLKRNGLFVYDVTQSLTAPSEYNLLVEKESKTC